MFSSLFKGSRALRLPLINGTVSVRRVKISKSLKRPAFLLFAGPLLVILVSRTSDYWLPEDFRKTLNALNDDFEKAKKEVATKSKQETFSESWQRAHERIQQNEKTANAAVAAPAATEQAQPLFITVPIWTRLKKMPKYKPTDPEWKEFVKLQEDDARVDALFRSIAQTVSAKFRKMDKHDQNLLFHDIEYTGEIGVGLEVLVPLSPPSLYEVPGLRFGPKGTQWAWRTLPESYGSRLHRTLHPIVFAKSFWKGMEVFWKLSYYKAKSYLGKYTSQNESTSYTMLEVLRGPLSGAGKTANLATTKISGAKEVGKATSQEDEADSLSPSILPVDKAVLMQAHRNFVSTVTSEGALKQAVAAFQKRFLSLQVAAWRELPRGACLIEGCIDFIGYRGLIRNRVVAIYLPAEDKFLGEPVIQAMNLFPYAPEYYLPSRKREQQKLVTRESGEVQEEEVAPTEPSQAPTQPSLEDTPLPVEEKGNLRQEQSKTGPQRLGPDNSIDQKGNEPKIAHEDGGQEKGASGGRPKKKDQEKNEP